MIHQYASLLFDFSFYMFNSVLPCYPNVKTIIVCSSRYIRLITHIHIEPFTRVSYLQWSLPPMVSVRLKRLWTVIPGPPLPPDFCGSTSIPRIAENPALSKSKFDIYRLATSVKLPRHLLSIISIFLNMEMCHVNANHSLLLKILVFLCHEVPLIISKLIEKKEELFEKESVSKQLRRFTDPPKWTEQRRNTHHVPLYQARLRVADFVVRGTV